MIATLTGKITLKSLSSIVLEVGGVGFDVLMSQSSLAKLGNAGEDVTVLTHMHVSDSAITLFGFLSAEEKSLFESLIGVSGVGPKMALAALSTFTPKDLASAIAAQDTVLVSKIPGVGKKTASRIILELKGSLDEGIGDLFTQDNAQSVLDARMSGATEALLSMGFTTAEIELALKGVSEGATESAILQYALKRLGSGLS